MTAGATKLFCTNEEFVIERQRENRIKRHSRKSNCGQMTHRKLRCASESLDLTDTSAYSSNSPPPKKLQTCGYFAHSKADSYLSHWRSDDLLHLFYGWTAFSKLFTITVKFLTPVNKPRMEIRLPKDNLFWRTKNSASNRWRYWFAYSAGLTGSNKQM